MKVSKNTCRRFNELCKTVQYLKDSGTERNFLNSSCAVKIEMDEKCNFYLDSQIQLSKKDKETIKSMLCFTEVEEHYFGDFYKIDLEEYILLYRKFVGTSGIKLYAGYIIKNNNISKLKVAEMYQKHLLRQYI